MTVRAWKLDQQKAHLRLGRLSARFRIAQPAQGLEDLVIASADPGGDTLPLGTTADSESNVEETVSVFGRSLGGVHLLGVCIPGHVPGDGDSVVEQHVRGTDLVLAYRESESWPVRVDTLWRARLPEGDDPFVAAVELITSVRTYLAQSGPQLSIRSTLPAVEVLRLQDPKRSRFQRVAAPDNTKAVFTKPGLSCTLMRLAGHDLSYVEMMHPMDFLCDELLGGGGSDRAFEVQHRLFPSLLEKGVMLRARLLAALVDRREDERLAAELYRRFSASGPCLSA